MDGRKATHGHESYDGIRDRLAALHERTEALRERIVQSQLIHYEVACFQMEARACAEHRRGLRKIVDGEGWLPAELLATQE